MKTQIVVFSVLVSATVAVHAQVTRYETNNLRKIAYMGQTTGCQQRIAFNGTYTTYEAIVPIPELSGPIAPPVISVLEKFCGEYVPVAAPGCPPGISFNNGNGYLYWKDVREYTPGVLTTNIYFTDFMIAFITEGGTTPLPFTLNGAVNPAGVTVSFPTEAGKVYGIEYIHNLGRTNVWQVLTNGITGTGGAVTITDTNGADRRFYRGKSQAP